jgi:putative NIF3 family GTP cyclohydrolase 1 type 2
LAGVSGRSAGDIAAYLDQLLNAAVFRENEPENGLVVDGGRPVKRVGVAVNTTFEAIDSAAAAGTELLLVHHTSWAYIDRSLHAPKMARLRELGISLYCAHASLDGADGIGTGFALANLIGMGVEGRFADYEGAPAGVYGAWQQGSLDSLLSAVVGAIGGQPEVIRGAKECRRIGIVTGAGGLSGWLDEARELGCDTFLTGEGSMYTRLFAKEAGMNMILAGHYRTEAPGIRGLAEELSAALDLPWTFIPDDPIG